MLDLVQRLKLVGNIFIASVRRPAKFDRSRSSRAGDIEDFNKSKMAAILDPVQMLKLIGNISIGSMRRRVKFGGILSSHAGDIIGFSKSKMAAVPPFWI